MSLYRVVPLHLHAATEALVAPLVMAAPFVLGFSPGASIAIFLVGALLLSFSLASFAEPRAIPVADHALIDYGFAVVAIMVGLLFGFGQAELGAALFLVGLGAAQVALTAATRFSLSAGT